MPTDHTQHTCTPTPFWKHGLNVVGWYIISARQKVHFILVQVVEKTLRFRKKKYTERFKMLKNLVNILTLQSKNQTSNSHKTVSDHTVRKKEYLE